MRETRRAGGLAALPMGVRASLLGGTGLVAVMFAAASAQAQGVPSALAARAAGLSATALPTGGKVVSGQASIAASGATLNVTQSSASAAVNWRSFDVGSAGTVNFTAPSPQSVTINQVVGPHPSVIAGRVTANDRLVLINQSGVLFTKGAEVNAQSLVVSAMGITEANLKAGRIELTMPAKPGAAVINQGRLTVAKTGLAALVAPQVANSGVIEARMGRVVLAGAEAATVDLYGDGLMSIDVTRQVTTAPLGPDGQKVTALVTNTGTIVASGGTVLLTAQAADGIITNLVLAGGRISADTAGTSAGRIVVDATGGGAAVTGTLSARGRRPGGVGGQIQVSSTATVGIAGTARLNASGRDGGGVIAVGTTLARAAAGSASAAKAPMAVQTLIAPGARIAANAGARGNGGKVVVLSSAGTYQGGSIRATGGRVGGDGGLVEISSQGGLSLPGTVNVSAPHGRAGTILIDPYDLAIEPDGTAGANNGLVLAGGLPFSVPDEASNAVITPASFDTMTGTVVLQASHNLLVDASFSYAAGQLTLQAGNNLTINPGATITPLAGSGLNLTLAAAVPGFANSAAGGVLAINGGAAADASAGMLALSAGSGGILLNGSVGAATISLATTGPVVQTSGSITAGVLDGSGGLGGAIRLGQSGNAIAEVTGLSTTAAVNGAVTLADSGSLTIAGRFGTASADPVSVQLGQGGTITLGTILQPATLQTLGTLSLRGDGLVLGSPASFLSGNVLEIAPANAALGVYLGDGTPAAASLSLSTALMNAASFATVRLGETGGTVTAAGIELGAGLIALNPFGVLDLQAAGALTQDVGNVLNAATLSGSVGSVAQTLAGGIATLGSFTVAGGPLALQTSTAITLAGPISASSVTVIAPSIGGGDDSSPAPAIQVAGSVVATGGTITLTALDDGSAVNPGVGLTIATPITIAATGTLQAGTVALNSLSTDVAGFAISQASGGVIQAGTLTGIVNSGSVALGGGNSVATLGDFSATALGRIASLALATGGTLHLAGAIDAATLDLSAAGDLTQVSGTVSAGILQSASGIGGNANLMLPGNAIAALGGLTVGGSLALRSDIGLAVNGTVAASNAFVELGAAGATLTIGQPFQIGAGGTLSLQADGFALGGATALTAARTGLLELASFSAEPLTTAAGGGVGSLDLSGVIGAVNTATLHLGGIGGAAPTASGITLGTLDLTGGAGFAQTLSLSAAGDVTQSGPLSVAALTGGVGGAITLTNAQNAIGGIGGGGLSAGSGIAIADAALTVAGPLALTGAGTISIAADSFSIAAGGRVAAGGQTVELGPLAGAVVQIGTAGNVGIDPGDLTAITAGTLRLGATAINSVKAGGVTLVSGGTVAAGQTLELDTSGSISQSGGTLQGGILAGTAGGGISLPGANAIASLGMLSSGGDIAITNAVSLGVTGLVSAGADHRLALVAPSLGITGGLVVGDTAGGGLITLRADAFDLAGSIGNAGGTVALAPLTQGGTMILGGGGLGVGGIAAPTVALGSLDGSSILAGSIDIAGAVALQAGSGLALFSSGAVTQRPGAVLSASMLSGTVGSLSLGEANSVDTLGALRATTGGIAFTNAGSLAVAGPVRLDSPGQTLSLGAASLSVTGTAADTLHAPAGTIELMADTVALPTTPAAGLISAEGGTVSVQPRGTGVAMGFAGAGLVADTIELGGRLGVARAASLTLGSLSVTGNLALDSLGAIGQSGPLVVAAGGSNAGILSANAGGTVTLGNAGNAVATIGTIAVGSCDFVFADAVAAAFNGPVTAATVSLTTTAAPGMTIAGLVQGSASVNLVAGAVHETASGGITTPSLTASATAAPGVIDLSPGANTIGAVGNVTAASSFLLVDSVNPNIAGVVSAPVVALTSSGAGGITIAGTINASSTLSLVANGGGIAEQGAGVLNVGTLQGSLSPGGIVSLMGVGNSIGTLGGFVDAGGVFALFDGHALQLGQLSAGMVAITESGAGIVLNGPVSGAGGVSLITNALTANGGAIGSDTLVEIAPYGGIGVSLGAGGGLVLGQSELGAIATPLLRIGAAGGVTTATTISVNGTASIAAGSALELDALSGIAIGGGGPGVLNAPVSAALLTPGGAITELAGSVLNTPSLTGQAGSVTLASTANTIGTLAGFSVGGGSFTLQDSTRLIQTGTLVAGVAVLGDSSVLAPSLTLAGSISVGTLDLSAAAGVAQTGGTITAATLQSAGGITGDVSLGQSGNAIGAMAGFDDGGGRIALTDSRALALTGRLVAGTLDLSVAGGVNQTGGVVIASVLQSSHGVGGDVSFGQSGNAIGTLGNFNVGGAGFSLQDSVPLTQTGTLTAGLATLNDSGVAAPSLTLAGTINVATLDLGAAAGVTQTAGMITAATLQSSAGVSGAVSLGQGGNAIGTLANFNVGGGSFMLQDAAALTQVGTLTAGMAMLRDSNATAPSLVFTGSVNVGTLDLNAAAGVSQTGGAITAGTVQSSGGVTGDVSLGQAGNAIGTLGGFNVGGAGFTLKDNAALTQTGTLTAGFARLSDSSVAAPSLTLAGTVNVGTLDLNAAAGVFQTGGVITAGTLLSGGGVTGTVLLGQGGNAIGTLANFNDGSGSFTLQDSAALTQTGTLVAGIARLNVSNSTAPLILAGTITVGTLDLNAAAGVTQTDGAIVAGTLQSSGGVAGNVVLGRTGNAIGTLANFNVGSANLTLQDSVALTQAGTLTAGVARLSDSSVVGPSLTFAGTIAVATLDLNAAAGVSQSAGVISAGTLQSGGGVIGNVTLGQSGNAIGTLANFNDGGGNFTLQDSAALTQAGTLVAGIARLNDGNAVAPMVLAGTIMVGTLDLNAAAGVSQTGGAIIAGTLRSSAGVAGNVALGQSGNAIGTLADFNVGGASFTLQDSAALTQTGTLVAGIARLSDGNVSAPLSLAGTIMVGTLDLNAAGGVAQTAGAITAATLQSSNGVAGDVTLGRSGNAIGTLASFDVGSGRFSLQDGVALTQTGTLTAGMAVLADSAIAAPSLTLAGTVAVGTLDLAAAAGVSQTGGVITAGTLLSSNGVVGNVTLGQGGNAIATLAGFNDGSGSFTLQDGAALTQTGALVAGLARLNASNVAAPLTLTGAITVGTLDLNAAAGVAQTAGAITAGTLQSSAGVVGNVTLGQSGNAIGTLAGFSVGGAGFTLQDSAALTQAGTLTAGFARLSDSNGAAPSLTLTGIVNVATLDLNASAGVAQTGGVITAGTLLSSGGVTGDVVLGQRGNAIGTLANFNDGSAGFTLQDSAALTQTGTLVAGLARLSDSSVAAPLTLAGTITVGTLDLNAAAGVSQTGGIITAGTLQSSGGVTGNVTLGQNGNAIGTLAGFDDGGGIFTLQDGASLTLAGAIVAGTLDLSAAGVSQTGGAITAGTLLSSNGVPGGALLGQGGNAIATLGGFSTGGASFALQDGAALTQTGTLTAGLARLSDSNVAAPSLTLAGTIVVGTLDLNAAAGVAQSGGVITAGTLQSSGGVTGAVSLGQSGNAIGTLASFNDGGASFTLVDAAPLTQTGSFTAGIATLRVNAAASPSLTFAGLVNVATLDLTAAASVVQSAGAITAGTLLSSGGVGGDVTLGRSGNAIGTLGNFNVGSAGFTLQDDAALTQVGTLTAGLAVLGGGNVAAPSLTLAGVVNVGTLDLSAAAGVVQTGGVITAGTLQSRGGVSGDVSLGQSGNAIGTLSNFNDGTGSFTLQDSAALTQTGALVAGIARLTDSNAAPITLAGAITVGTLDLNAAGVVQTGGTITASVLQSSAGVTGNVVLGQGGNAIGTLANFDVGGASFTLQDAAALTQTGTLSAGFARLVDSNTAAPSLTLAGTVNVGTLDLNAAAGVSQTGGVITAGTLLSSNGVTGNVSLGQSGNAIGTLANFNDGSAGFVLQDSAPLTQTGTLIAGLARLSDSNVTTPLTLAGAITVGTLDLNAAAGVSQTGGAITAGTLQSSNGVTGNVTLGQSGNAIGTLANFNVGNGSFVLQDAAALTQIGTLSAASITLAELSPAATALTLAGLLNGQSAITLTSAGGGIVETAGGVLNTPLLSGSAAGGANVALLGSANTIGGVGGFSVPGGSFALLDSVDPNVAGPVSAAIIRLTVDGPAGLTIAGPVTGTTSVSLNTQGGGVRESLGAIATPLLLSDTGITGNAILTGPGNAIATLGSVAISGGLQLSEAGSLTLLGPVSTTQGAAITATGGLTLAGTLAAPGQSVGLFSGNAIVQTGGVITASVVSASAASISLVPGSAGNRIDSFAAVAAPGGVSLESAVPLTLAGPIGGASITVFADAPAGTLTLAGPITSPGAVTLVSPLQSVVQTGGTISAGTLVASAGGDVLLDAAGNRIATLGPVSNPGSLAVADTGALLVAGPIRSGNVSLEAGGGITLFGNVDTATLDLATRSGGVSQTGGTLSLATLAASQGIVGDATLTSGGNRIASLGNLSVTAGRLTLADAASLAVLGTVSAADVSFTTPGSITLPGTLTTNTLTLQTGDSVVRPAGAGALAVDEVTGVIAGTANFGSGAQIGSLGPLTVTGANGTLTLFNAIPLSVTGPLTAPYIAVTATDQISLTGTITTTGLPLQSQAVGTVPVDPGSYFSVVSGPNGGAPAIRQTGTALFQPSSGAGAATVRLNLPANGGSIFLNNLVGPQASVILYTGTAGTATGTLTVGSLRVIGAQGSTSLFGSVADTGGPQAAREATIAPNSSTNYRLNGCPIASVNCVLLPIGVLPITNPLRDFLLDLGNSNGDADDLALPDVSSTDY